MTQKYTPTTWIGGKTIGTADVMNNIEQGIVGAYDELKQINSQLEHKVNLNSLSYVPITKFGEYVDGDNTQLFANAISLVSENSIIDLEGKTFNVKFIDINKSNIGFKNGKIICGLEESVGYYNGCISVRDNNTNISFEGLEVHFLPKSLNSGREVRRQ